MSAETIIGIVVAGVIALSLIYKLLPKRQPKETHFKCSRCGTNSRHTERTIEAWRNNKTTFFCQSCHAKWLQSRPPQKRERFSSSGGASSGDARSGCLGVVVLFALAPLAGYLLVQAYASV
jgi:hypothetical protein